MYYHIENVVEEMQAKFQILILVVRHSCAQFVQQRLAQILVSNCVGCVCFGFRYYQHTNLASSGILYSMRQFSYQIYAMLKMFPTVLPHSESFRSFVASYKID